MAGNTDSLGRLEPVDVRKVWETEAGDFTPWLAKDDNLALLGDTIGLVLELEAQEKNVGPFRADILCRDTKDSSWVLIENQLERTDHTHLGQVMTYAAGLKVVTIVWIAYRFTEEHRAALDWLNEITDERFNFFGLEVELWRIGKSPIAPKFNVVCKPNEWTKAPPASTGELTPTKLLQHEYWKALRDLLIERNGIVKPQKPQRQHWTTFALGRSYFGMHAGGNTQKHCIEVGINCYGPDAKPHYFLLEQDKEAIEQEIKESLDWEELPNKNQSRIALRKLQADPTNRDDWPVQHQWMIEKLEAFHKTFSPRVKQLGAEEYEAPDEE